MCVNELCVSVCVCVCVYLGLFGIQIFHSPALSTDLHFNQVLSEWSSAQVDPEEEGKGKNGENGEGI